MSRLQKRNWWLTLLRQSRPGTVTLVLCRQANARKGLRGTEHHCHQHRHYQQHWSIKCEIMSMVAIAITDECSALAPLQIHAITEKLVAVVGGGEDGVNHASPTACNVPPTA